MPDRSIPYCNVIIKCCCYPREPVNLDRRYRLRGYKAGDEGAWGRIEAQIGDFDSTEVAGRYFVENYLGKGREADLLFAEDCASGEVVGTVLAWQDMREGKQVNSLHWLAVARAHRGRGIGKVLCLAALERFRERNGKPVYLHTQPWSYPAILLYGQLGFRVQSKESFAGYENQCAQAMEVLRRVLSREEYDRLCGWIE